MYTYPIRVLTNWGGGANYISDYGWEFYQAYFQNQVTTPLLPSTIFWLKQKLHFAYSDFSLFSQDWIPAFVFWRQNMIATKGLSAGHHYHFIGILQPVLNTSAYRYNDKETYEEDTRNYAEYYPLAKKYIAEEDRGLYDFTTAFDTATGKVYLDNCHLNAGYQPTIAQKVLEVLKEKKIL